MVRTTVSHTTNQGKVPPFMSREVECSVAGRPTTQGRKVRVLVVDDELLIADSVAEILKGNGFDCIAVYSGESAIETAKAYCPDILLSDVLMPHINGVEAAIAIHDACPEARILLFSGQAATADILLNARQRGFAFELLPKPIHPQQLIKTLKA